MIHIFDWVADIVVAIGDTVSQTVTSMGEAIAKSIFGAFLQWIYEMIYGAVADFFSYISIMGAEIFELNWVKATIQLFAYFGWALFIAGTIVAIFDVAIEYQSGRANIKNTSLNIFFFIYIEYQFLVFFTNDFINIALLSIYYRSIQSPIYYTN